MVDSRYKTLLAACFPARSISRQYVLRRT